MLRWRDSRPFGLGKNTYAGWLLASLAVLLSLCGACYAAPAPLELGTKGGATDLAPYIRYFEDKDKRLGPQEAYRLDLERDYRPVATNLVDFGFTRSRFWLRASVRNATDRTGIWKLVPDVPNIAELAVYVVDGAGAAPRLIFSTDDDDPFSARGERYRNFATDLELDAGAQVDLLISYSSEQATQLPLFIASPDRFYGRVRAEDMHNWALYALLVGMTLMSAVYVAALGFNTAVYYAAYILLSGLYLFHTDGYAFQYLWPGLPWWNKVAVGPIGLALVASGSLFARAYIDAPRLHPVLNRVLIGAAVASTTLLVLSFGLLRFDWFKTAALLFAALCAVLQLSAGALAVRQGQAGGWLFLGGAAAVISAVLFGIFGYLNPGNFNQDIAGHAARYALLVEGAAFALAVFLHTQNLRREHDGALRREIEIGGEKLALSEALRSAEGGYRHAVELAETRRAQLASTAHDIKQPLTSLRMALMRLNADTPETAEQITRSFDYLDDLVRSNLESTTPEAVAPGTELLVPPALDGHAAFAERTDPSERFEVSVVLNNVAAMFRDEAAAKGVELKLVPSGAMIETAPVPLMRMVSNLVSNAVKHAGEGTVLLGCRHAEGGVRIEVHDNGPGMPEDEVERVLKPYTRGERSDGTGLGLALVTELAREHGLTFTLTSVEGRGTVAAITVPRA